MYNAHSISNISNQSGPKYNLSTGFYDKYLQFLIVQISPERSCYLHIKDCDSDHMSSHSNAFQCTMIFMILTVKIMIIMLLKTFVQRMRKYIIFVKSDDICRTLIESMGSTTGWDPFSQSNEEPAFIFICIAICTLVVLEYWSPLYLEQGENVYTDFIGRWPTLKRVSAKSRCKCKLEFGKRTQIFTHFKWKEPGCQTLRWPFSCLTIIFAFLYICAVCNRALGWRTQMN